jgi:hypothetical protein
VFQIVVPFSRYCTATLALRLASPSMRHSKPRFCSVGRSTRKAPALTLSVLEAAQTGASELAISSASALREQSRAFSTRRHSLCRIICPQLP